MEEDYTSTERSQTQTEMNTPKKARSTLLDGREACFLCLGKRLKNNSNDKCNLKQVCFRNICRYLNINAGSILYGQNRVTTNDKERRSRNAEDLSVLLCSECSSHIEKLSSLIQQVEISTMLISHYLDKVEMILSIYSSGHGGRKPGPRRGKTDNNITGTIKGPDTAHIMDQLRRETKKKCSAKLKQAPHASHFPKVQLSRIKPTTLRENYNCAATRLDETNKASSNTVRTLDSLTILTADPLVLSILSRFCQKVKNKNQGSLSKKSSFQCRVCKSISTYKRQTEIHLINMHPELFFSGTSTPSMSSDAFRRCCKEVLRSEARIARERSQSDGMGHQAVLCSVCSKNCHDGSALSYHYVLEHYKFIEEKIVNHPAVIKNREEQKKTTFENSSGTSSLQHSQSNSSVTLKPIAKAESSRIHLNRMKSDFQVNLSPSSSSLPSEKGSINSKNSTSETVQAQQNSSEVSNSNATSSSNCFSTQQINPNSYSSKEQFVLAVYAQLSKKVSTLPKPLYNCLVCNNPKKLHSKYRIRKHLANVHPEKFFLYIKPPSVSDSDFRSLCRNVFTSGVSDSRKWMKQFKIDVLKSTTVVCQRCGKECEMAHSFKPHYLQKHYSIVEEKISKQAQEVSGLKDKNEAEPTGEVNPEKRKRIDSEENNGVTSALPGQLERNIISNDQDNCFSTSEQLPNIVENKTEFNNIKRPKRSSTATLPKFAIIQKKQSRKKIISNMCKSKFRRHGNRFECLICKKLQSHSSYKYHLVNLHPEQIFASARLGYVSKPTFKDCCRYVLKTEGIQAARKDGKLVASGVPISCLYCNQKCKGGHLLRYHMVLTHYTIIKNNIMQHQRKNTADRSKLVLTRMRRIRNAALKKASNEKLESGKVQIRNENFINSGNANLENKKVWTCYLEDGGCGQKFPFLYLLRRHERKICTKKIRHKLLNLEEVGKISQRNVPIPKPSSSSIHEKTAEPINTPANSSCVSSDQFFNDILAKCCEKSSKKLKNLHKGSQFKVAYHCLLCTKMKKPYPKSTVQKHLVNVHSAKVFDNQKIQGLSDQKFLICCKEALRVESAQEINMSTFAADEPTEHACKYCSYTCRGGFDLRYHCILNHYAMFIEKLNQIQHEKLNELSAATCSSAVQTERPKGNADSANGSVNELVSQICRAQGITPGTRTGRYKCAFCRKFLIVQIYRHHLVNLHPEKILFSAKPPSISNASFRDSCKRLLKSLAKAAAKRVKSSENKTIPCLYCSKSYRGEYWLKYHIGVQHSNILMEKLIQSQSGEQIGIQQQPIEQDQGSFPKQNQRTVIKRKKYERRNRKILICSVTDGGCGRKFSSNATLKWHKNHHCSARIRKASKRKICIAKPDLVVITNNQDLQVNKLTCSSCGEYFESGLQLWKHKFLCGSNRITESDPLEEEQEAIPTYQENSESFSEIEENSVECSSSNEVEMERTTEGIPEVKLRIKGHEHDNFKNGDENMFESSEVKLFLG